MMEEETDLRIYFEVLLRHWKWIVVLTAGMAVAAFIYTSMQSSFYRASSVVLVTRPRYEIQFDPRFRTEQGMASAYRAFPTLAVSDDVLQGVVDAYAPPSEASAGELTLQGLSGIIEATSEDDPSLILLKVRSLNPEEAAAIANLWADVFVKQGNEIFGGSEEDVAFFEEQLAQAEEALAATEAELIAFQARNQGSIVQGELNSLLQTQAEYLTSQHQVALLLQDIHSLRTQLAELPNDQSASLADNITALFLQIKAYGAESETGLQLAVDSEELLSERSRAEQLQFLDGLLSTLQAKSKEIEEQLAELEPQTLALQQTLEEMNVESDRLSRARSVARDTQVTLARKLDEARISAQEENGTLRIGSYAAVPTRAIGPRKVFNTAVAVMLSLLVGVAVAFGIEFWRRNLAPRLDEDE
jgi:uncharacterized protein involved in exopolysaccharide biosynthesis